MASSSHWRAAEAAAQGRLNIEGTWQRSRVTDPLIASSAAFRLLLIER